MKHTKKWLQITASTLALTGAIATPITLTSCSNNENGPVDKEMKVEIPDLDPRFTFSDWRYNSETGRLECHNDQLADNLKVSDNYFVYNESTKNLGAGAISASGEYYFDFRICDVPITSFDENTFKTYGCPNGEIDAIILPEGITNFPEYVFLGYYDLNFLYIPETVTSIGTQGLYRCGSSDSSGNPHFETNIPSGMKNIGDNNFFISEYDLNTMNMTVKVFLDDPSQCTIGSQDIPENYNKPIFYFKDEATANKFRNDSTNGWGKLSKWIGVWGVDN